MRHSNGGLRRSLQRSNSLCSHTFSPPTASTVRRSMFCSSKTNVCGGICNNPIQFRIGWAGPGHLTACDNRIHSMAHTASTAQHPQHGTYSIASATIQSNSESAATEHSKAKKAKLSHCAAAPDSTAAMHVLPHDVLSSPSSRLRTSWAGSHARHVPELRESHDSQLPRLLLAQSCSLLHSKPTLTSADRPSRLLRFDWRSVSDDHS